MADGENIAETRRMTGPDPEEPAAATPAGGEPSAAPGADDDAFDAPARVDAAADIDALVVNLDGYEGPLDVLLDLARSQKVDIRRISMTALVDQYLAFVEEAKKRNLELAADYLVMAAWLAFLKSKLLLPVETDDGDEPTADEMAARLAFQLQRLEAMRQAVDALQARPQLGVDFFPRGAPEGVRTRRTPEWQASLYDLLRAYAVQRIAVIDRDYHIDPPKVFSIEAARARLERILGALPDWTDLRALARIEEVDAPDSSKVASAFNAALEFAKDGRIDLRQLGAFEPIYIRARADKREGTTE